MEEEKIIQLDFPKEFNDILKNSISNFEPIPESFDDILKETINLSYLSRKIRGMSLHAFKYHDLKAPSWYKPSVDKNYLSQKFIVFLNKPKVGGALIVNNLIYGKKEIASEENKLVVMPSEYNYYLTPASEDRFLIEGHIIFDERFN